jgi:hypothetical protein
MERPNTPENAIEYLKSLNPDQNIVSMFILQSEIEEVTGLMYTPENMERLTSLLCRSPREVRQSYGNSSLESNYWYENRLLFKRLVMKGIEYLRKDELSDRISESNYKLRKELDLSYSLSLDFEIRPLRKLGEGLTLDEEDSPDTILVKSHDDEFEVDANIMFADLLEMVDTEERSRPFLEEMSYTEIDVENKTATLYLGWGS